MMISDDFPAPRGPRVHTPLMYVQGAHPGPRFVVTGREPVVRAVAEMLWTHAAISQISGVLILRPNTQSPHHDRPDSVLTIKGNAVAACHRTLTWMAALGMIPEPVPDQLRVA